MPTSSSLAAVAILTFAGHPAGPAPFVRVAAAVADTDSPTRYLVGDLRVTHPRLLPSSDGRQAAAFVLIENRGKSTDTLVEASVEGVPRTTVAPGPQTIGPDGKVEMGPQGPHLVLDGAAAPFKEGDHVRGVLRFERAGPLRVEFRVVDAAEPPDPAP